MEHMENNALKLLIVEDDVDLNKAYQMILATKGYEVSSVFDGRQALDFIEKNGDPDIIFLDLRMPVLDGLGFLKEFNAPSHTSTVVVFSNYDAQKEVDEAYELGADRYVLKARAAPKELLRIVDDIAEDRRSLKR